MSRLPNAGGDEGVWGDILNDFLLVSHNADGTLKNSGILASKADDSAVVHNTGNENIAGVKVFSSSPIVPNPSTGAQAANKSYVDTAISHGTPGDPSLFGLALWTLPIYSATVTYGPGTQTFYGVLTRSSQSVTITSLGTWVATAGSSPGTGINGMAIYSESGTLLAQTGDMTAGLQTVGYTEGTLTSSVAISADTNYYLCYLCNFTNAPVLATNSSSASPYPTIRGHVAVPVLFGQTSFPSSFTPSSATSGNLPLFFTAGE